eukprot:9268612-Karenia_brevis.AAC.1
MATKVLGPSKEGLDRRNESGAVVGMTTKLLASSEEETPLSQAQRKRKEAAENDTSDEDEDGVKRVRRGEKEAGTGPCLMVTGLGKKRAFHDGCGLSSAGRWEPERRTNRGGLWV